jgi:two-component sensor histidine kinase
MSVTNGDDFVILPLQAGNSSTSHVHNGHAAPSPVNTRRFRHDVSSVRQARLFASECAVLLTPHQASVLILLVSELATNCVKHSRTDFEVTIDVNDSSARVQVADEGPGLPRPGDPRPHDTSGRGLLVVQELSDEWGILPGDNGKGKTVWFSMSLA